MIVTPFGALKMQPKFVVPSDPEKSFVARDD